MTIHLCPPDGSNVMPCCGVPPLERRADRMTLDDRLVTCGRSCTAKAGDELGAFCSCGHFVAVHRKDGCMLCEVLKDIADLRQEIARNRIDQACIHDCEQST